MKLNINHFSLTLVYLKKREKESRVLSLETPIWSVDYSSSISLHGWMVIEINRMWAWKYDIEVKIGGEMVAVWIHVGGWRVVTESSLALVGFNSGNSYACGITAWVLDRCNANHWKSHSTWAARAVAAPGITMEHNDDCLSVASVDSLYIYTRPGLYEPFPTIFC